MSSTDGMTKREISIALVSFIIGVFTILAILFIVLMDHEARPTVGVVDTQLATQTFQSCVKDLALTPNNREYASDITAQCKEAALTLSTTLPGSKKVSP